MLSLYDANLEANFNRLVIFSQKYFQDRVIIALFAVEIERIIIKHL